MPFEVLLAVDGSSHSLIAVRSLATTLARSSARYVLRLMHVQYRIPPRAAAAVGREIVESYYRSETEEAVKAAKRLLDGAGVSHRLVRRIGNPATEIARYAENEQIDLIVMGSHGHGAAKSLLLGSVAQGVVAGCRTAVLIVRENSTPSPDREVLVAVDGSAFSRRALAYLLRHRQLLAPDASITLMHVTTPIRRGVFRLDRSEEIRLMDAEHERVMRSARNLITRAQVPWKVAKAQGNAGAEIAAYAKKHDPALIVMGSHGHGLMTGMLLGSVTQKTIGLCRAPVLLVR